jgi:hypothetical protein
VHGFHLLDALRLEDDVVVEKQDEIAGRALDAEVPLPGQPALRPGDVPVAHRRRPRP